MGFVALRKYSQARHGPALCQVKRMVRKQHFEVPLDPCQTAKQIQVGNTLRAGMIGIVPREQ
jgi:hypothetical protein